MDIKRLAEPFAPEQIHWRIGATNQKKIARETNNQKARPTKGIALAYIDARDVMERLDEICGPENWQSKYEHASNHGYVCSIGICINNEWVWKANGAGETQVEAQKGASSDSFKRAAILWGIGRYLYDVKSPWVNINEYGDIDPNDKKKLVSMLPNAPRQQEQKTPFDEPNQQDEVAQELEDLKSTISQITTIGNLKGLWATGRVKSFWEKANDDQRRELETAKEAKKAQLTVAA